jgi:hypothetical protein
VITSQPNKTTPLETTWICLRLARPTRTTSSWLIGCMEGSTALLWINKWIGHMTRTKHRDTRLEYRASESKSVKWVERKWLAWKDCRRTPEELVVAHITTKLPIRKEANCYNKKRMQHLLLWQKIGIPTHTYMVQVVLLHDNFVCWLAWK